MKNTKYIYNKNIFFISFLLWHTFRELFSNKKLQCYIIPFGIVLFQRRNRKHLLMLRCLAINDLVALLGMWIQMYIKMYITIYIGNVISMRIFCSLRVVWRLFGLFSGCVAIVMAAERWLALTRPFVYQKVSLVLR